jgi:hypothetical protein
VQGPVKAYPLCIHSFRYSPVENVHHGIVCGACPGCLQQGKEIQSPEPSVDPKSHLKPAFDSTSAPGNALDSNVMNIHNVDKHGTTTLTVPLMMTANKVTLKIEPCSTQFS